MQDPPQFTSRAKFAFDGVLPMQYQLRSEPLGVSLRLVGSLAGTACLACSAPVGEAYLSKTGNPLTDMYLSPIIAPAELLKQFPQVGVSI